MIKRRNRRVQALTIFVLLAFLLSNAKIVTETQSKVTEGAIAGVTLVFHENLKNAKILSQDGRAGISEVIYKILKNTDISTKDSTTMGEATTLLEKREQPVTTVAQKNSQVANCNMEDNVTKNESKGGLDISEETINSEEEVTEEVNTEATPDPYEVELLAHLINGEAGNQPNESQLAVGAVALNRVKSDKFPNTLKEVIFQNGQYACTWDGNFDKEPSSQAWENARWLLQNELSETPEVVLPENVVFQAQFKQGSGVYKKIGPLYFCYQ